MRWMKANGRLSLLLLLVAAGICSRARGQAALLMEEPFGIATVLDPTGHEAIYFQRICAETPTRLRRCAPGESGAVIARYHGIAGYDWVAIPWMPYLYSVDNAGEVPPRVDRASAIRLRTQYHDAHLMSLGKELPMGGALHRGWSQLVGVAFDRRIDAFQFQTSAAQDDALIARLNAQPNRSHFNLEYNNCADFAAGILNFYFPHAFHRRILPDAGITTPRQNAYELAHYARAHPAIDLKVYRIPLVPGLHSHGRTNEGVAESLIGAGYVLPLALINPFLGAGVVIDYLAFGRYPLRLKGAQKLAPADLAPLTARVSASGENGGIAADAGVEGRMF